MGRRSEPLRFVCRACGKQQETWNTGNRGIYCNKACRADYERKGRDQPTRYKQGGYWMLRWNVGGRYVWQFEHRRVWEDANGPIPEGHAIHHVNQDKLDNRIENLRCMRHYDHYQEHRLYHTREEDLAARRIAAKRSRDKRRLDPEWVERERLRSLEKNRRARAAKR